jgi:hypothetical protein
MSYGVALLGISTYSKNLFTIPPSPTSPAKKLMASVQSVSCEILIKKCIYIPG